MKNISVKASYKALFAACALSVFVCADGADGQKYTFSFQKANAALKSVERTEHTFSFQKANAALKNVERTEHTFNFRRALQLQGDAATLLTRALGLSREVNPGTYNERVFEAIKDDKTALQAKIKELMAQKTDRVNVMASLKLLVADLQGGPAVAGMEQVGEPNGYGHDMDLADLVTKLNELNGAQKTAVEGEEAKIKADFPKFGFVNVKTRADAVKAVANYNTLKAGQDGAAKLDAERRVGNEKLEAVLLAGKFGADNAQLVDNVATWSNELLGLGDDVIGRVNELAAAASPEYLAAITGNNVQDYVNNASYDDLKREHEGVVQVIGRKTALMYQLTGVGDPDEADDGNVLAAILADPDKLAQVGWTLRNPQQPTPKPGPQQQPDDEPKEENEHEN